MMPAPWNPDIRRRVSDMNKEEMDRDYLNPGTPLNDTDPAGYSHANLAGCHNRFIHQNLCVAFGEGFGQVASLADLSAGDGRIPKSLAAYSGITAVLGDYGNWGYQYQGTYQETVPQIEPVELFVSTNTLEHLDDPDGDMKLIRTKCDKMLLSCPIDEVDAGGQHLWFWTREGVEDIFKAAGFQQEAYCELDENPVWEHFKFGIWALS
jgi:hypothetical protein